MREDVRLPSGSSPPPHNCASRPDRAKCPPGRPPQETRPTRLLRTTPTSGTPIFRQASKKLSTFFLDLRALSFGWMEREMEVRGDPKCVLGGGPSVPNFCPGH